MREDLMKMQIYLFFLRATENFEKFLQEEDIPWELYEEGIRGDCTGGRESGQKTTTII